MLNTRLRPYLRECLVPVREQCPYPLSIERISDTGGYSNTINRQTTNMHICIHGLIQSSKFNVFNRREQATANMHAYTQVTSTQPHHTATEQHANIASLLSATRQRTATQLANTASSPARQHSQHGAGHRCQRDVKLRLRSRRAAAQRCGRRVPLRQAGGAGVRTAGQKWRLDPGGQGLRRGRTSDVSA
jgi:hypothetical protein